jgi:preprotein translocase subunit SecE
MKKSIEKKQLKKVFLILIMSISMAILFVGINVIFGKVIL